MAHGNFRVTGDGYYPSKQFVLPEGRDRYAVSAQMKDSSVGGPIALILVGNGLLWIAAPIFFVVGATQESNNSSGSGAFILGGATAITGAALAITGTVMLVVQAQEPVSKTQVARTKERRLRLPAGFELERRGVVF
jgi:hypothetical protein